MIIFQDSTDLEKTFTLKLDTSVADLINTE